MSVSEDKAEALAAEEVARKMSGPPDAARAWMRELAEHGAARAQALLGQMLLDGFGGPADPVEALAWFVKASAAGDALAFNMVGRCYENGWGAPADITVAAEWYRQAAEKGSDWGMYNHATRLMLGDGVAENRSEALAWFQRAAALGHAKSINIVGGFHEDGWEVVRDLAIAAEHYARAAAAGDFRGQFNLGRVLASQGEIDGALTQFRNAARTATPAFIAKMTAFLRSAPIQAYRDLADEFETKVLTP
jgi:TPR repeat protein